MSNWILITVNDIPTYVVDALVNAMRTSALGDDQDDPLPTIIEDISENIRLEIASCKTNQLDTTAHSIPAELKSDAIALIAEKALGRLTLDLTEDQRRAADTARSTLKRIANGDRTVTRPDTAQPEPSAQSTGGISVVASRNKNATSRNLDRL